VAVPTGTGTGALSYSPALFVRLNPNFGYASTSSDTFRGQTTLKNFALMPAWGTPAGNVTVFGYVDTASASLVIDNVVFLPWGWYENSKTSGASTNTFSGFNVNAGGGGGSWCNIGTIHLFAQYWGSVIGGFDTCTVRQVNEYYCYNGLALGCTWSNQIDECDAYGVVAWAVEFMDGFARGNRLRRLNIEPLTVTPVQNYAINIATATTRVMVDYVLVWPSQAIGNTKYQAITNDDSRLEGNCLGFNIGNTMTLETFPKSVVYSTPFGGAISANLFGSASYPSPPWGGSIPGMGIGGSTMTPVSGAVYTLNVPLLVSSSGGAGVVIYAQKATGYILDNGVATLTGRFLWPGDTLKVSYTTGSPPTITAYLASIGDTPVNAAGMSASPTAGVIYVAYGEGIDISFSDATATASTTDGSVPASSSSSTGGVALDTALTSMVNYHLSPGQTICFSAAPSTPPVVRRHRTP
jgi:hypothetical protein